MTQGRISTADGRFNPICQVAPMCPPMRVHWHNLMNTIKLVLPSAHASPQPKRQMDWFSHFCTAHGRVLSGMSFPLTIAPSHGGSGPHLIHASLGLPESTAQMASRSVQPICRAHWRDRPTDRPC